MSNYHKLKEQRQREVKYTISNAEINRIKIDATKKGTVAAFEILLGLTCLVLHNSFGFGQQRCTAVCDRICAMFKKLDQDGCISLKEVQDAAKKLGGVKGVL